uniref:RING-type domain-containing protein n=1 Tax=Alexandrium monilatum TaxID=311494 RepID=A0A7S4RUQ6_9DINO
MAPAVRGTAGSLCSNVGEVGEVEVHLRLADVALFRRALPTGHSLLEECDEALAVCEHLAPSAELDEATAEQHAALRRLAAPVRLQVRLAPEVAAGVPRRRKAEASSLFPCCAEGAARMAEYVMAKVALVLRWHRCIPLATGLWAACAGLCAGGCFLRPENTKCCQGRGGSGATEADEDVVSSCCRERRRWPRQQAEQLERLVESKLWAQCVCAATESPPPWSFGHGESRRLSLRLEELPSESLPRLCEVQGSRPEDELQARLSKTLHERCFLCPLCAQWRERKQHQVCPRGHAWCSQCFARWVAQPQQLARLARQRSLAVQCLHSASSRCPEFLPEAYTRPAGRCTCGRRACSCGPLPRLVKDIEYRRQLISRASGRRCVDCPQTGCVGVAYMGQPKLMCFICEHQWSDQVSLAEYFLLGSIALLLAWPGGLHERVANCAELLATSAAAALFAWAVVELVSRHRRPALPEGCKRCPCCGMVIFKNGGCDHMTCRCGHEFWWTTMRPYPTTH